MKKSHIALMAIATGSLIACQPQKPKDETPKEESVPAFDIANLDTTVAPCTDFFDFAAGGFIKNNPIPESESRWGQFNALIERNNEKIKTILESFAGKDGLASGSEEQIIGDLYASGMDTAKIDADGLKHLQPLLDEIAAIQSLDDYFAKMAMFDFKGVQNPFGVYVSPDQKNSSMNVLYAGQSGTSLPDRDYYLKTDSTSVDIQNKYKAFVAQMLELAGSKNATAEAEMIYNMEYKLAEAQMSRIDRRNPELTYNKMSVADLAATTPTIQWDTYFNGLNIAADTLIVGQPDFLQKLDAWYQEVSIEDLKTYIRFKALNSYADQLPSGFEQAQFDFYSTTLRGTKKMKPRWRRTLNNMGGMSEQIGHLFVNEHFSPESKERVSQMVEDLRAAYRDRIQQLSWMSDETKTKAIEKLNGFTYKIGYPDEWEDVSSLKISKDSYLQNIMNITEYRTKENYAELGQPVDKSDWFMGAHVVNAYYNPLFNEVVFPAGILQPPFYNPDADDAINYGGIGGVIGHEFTHGFDDKGSLYDVHGNLSNWWTDEDREAFDKLVQNVITQYDGYEALPGVNVQGALTVGENIADFGGLTLAYYAYQKSREGKPEVEPIDGFTPEQRIFMGWAQVWQTSQTEEFTRNQVMTDPHSPAHFRVIGPMSNMKEFEHAYGCGHSEGSFIRPDSTKIVIW